jgi:hypothetical protein
MTDFSCKLTLVRCVCDAWPNLCPDARKAASDAVFWLADLLAEEAQRRCPPGRLQYLLGNLKAMRDRAAQGAKNGELDVDLLHEDARNSMGLIPDEHPQ